MTPPRAKHHRHGPGRGRAEDRHPGGTDLHGVTRKLRCAVYTRKSSEDVYSQLGQRALEAGLRPVFVGSKPYEAWCKFRGGADSMPGFVDRARIDGRMREFVWLPSVYPPKHPAQDAEGGGGW